MFRRIVSVMLAVVILNHIFPNCYLSGYSDEKGPLFGSNYVELVERTLSNYGSIPFISDSSDKRMAIAERDNALRLLGAEVFEVTSNTVKDVETILKTDLSFLPLDEGLSFTVVVYGEENPSKSSPSSSFSYVYNGATYTLRYLSVTANDISIYAQTSYADMLKSKTQAFLERLLDSLFYAVLDEVSDCYLGTVASICGISVSNIGFASNMSMLMHAGTNWTRVFTQVWNPSYNEWELDCSVEYVYQSYHISGYYYNPHTNQMAMFPTNESHKTVYSSKFTNFTWRKQQAVIVYLSAGPCAYDKVGTVRYKNYYNGNPDYIFITHYENF